MKLSSGLTWAFVAAVLLGGVGTCHQYREAAKAEARAERADSVAAAAQARADSLDAVASRRLDSLSAGRQRADSEARAARDAGRRLSRTVGLTTDSVARALPDSALHLIERLRAAQAELEREHERETQALRHALAVSDSTAALWEARFRAERAAREALEAARDEWRQAANPGFLATLTTEAPKVALYAGAGFVACAVLC